MKIYVKKFLSLLLCISMLFMLVACDDDGENSEAVKPASFGTYGADFAREFAKEHPYRKPYSEGERAAGLMIKEEFESLGY